MEDLAEHGVFLPPNMQGLTDEQVEELKLRDEWGERCVPSGGAGFKKDTVGRRNGRGERSCGAAQPSHTARGWDCPAERRPGDGPRG